MLIEFDNNRLKAYVEPDFAEGPVPSAASIGTFDGLHRGHLLVVATLMRAARANHLRPLVFSFDRHPLEVVAPERAPGVLLSPERRVARLVEYGVQPVTVVFTDEVRHISAREWLRILRDEFGVRLLVLGYDNTFGNDGHTMGREELITAAEETGLKVIEAPQLEGASSSAARKAIKEGDVSAAARILGYPYTIYGKVVAGEQLGRTIGFPTANLEPESKSLIPKEGVYAAMAVIDGEDYPAMVNIGRRPTVSDADKVTIEVHILDFHGDLYDQELGVRFMKRLREERKFASVEELTRQLEKDRTQIRTLFGI